MSACLDPMTPEQLDEWHRQKLVLHHRAMLAAGYKPVEGKPGYYQAELILEEPMKYVMLICDLKAL